MKHPPLSLETTVPEALAATNCSTGVFRKHRTACVGCYLARFCTLRDVANTYGLSPEAFLSDLERAAEAKSIPDTGAQNEDSL